MNKWKEFGCDLADTSLSFRKEISRIRYSATPGTISHHRSDNNIATNRQADNAILKVRRFTPKLVRTFERDIAIPGTIENDAERFISSCIVLRAAEEKPEKGACGCDGSLSSQYHEWLSSIYHVLISKRTCQSKML